MSEEEVARTVWNRIRARQGLVDTGRGTMNGRVYELVEPLAPRNMDGRALHYALCTMRNGDPDTGVVGISDIDFIPEKGLCVTVVIHDLGN